MKILVTNIHHNACRAIYPQEYRKEAFVRFTSLPLELNQFIHQKRASEDINIPLEVCKKILGYYQSSEKDAALERISSGMEVDSFVVEAVEADRQVALLYFYLYPAKIGDMPIFQNDKGIIQIVCQQDATLFRFADAALKADKIFVQTLFRLPKNKKATIIQFVSKNLRNHSETMKMAVQQNENALKYSSSQLKNDLVFMTFAISCNANTMKYVGKHLRENDEFKKLNKRKSN